MLGVGANNDLGEDQGVLGEEEMKQLKTQVRLLFYNFYSCLIAINCPEFFQICFWGEVVPFLSFFPFFMVKFPALFTFTEKYCRCALSCEQASA